MKLNEVYKTSLKEVTEAMELSEMKVHTDENGNVKSIELKYICEEGSKAKAEAKTGIPKDFFDF